MLKFLRHRKGQAVSVEYTLTFFLVAATITAMATYFKRAIQGSIYSARKYMKNQVEEVYSNPSYNFVGELTAQYEPYYLKSQASREVSREEGKFVGPSFNSSAGIFHIIVNEEISATSRSEQAAPGDAD